MWNMTSSSAPFNMGNVVVTNVVPVELNAQQQQLLGRSRRFKKGQPKALGVVQIMIGVVIITFGIAMALFQHSIGVSSGIFVWGALIYIAAGSLGVAAENSLNLCLINGSLALNILAGIIAGTGTILFILDSIVWNGSSDRYYYSGFAIVFALFHFLEFIVANTSAGYICNATCSCCGAGQHINQTVETVEGAFATQGPPQFQSVSVPFAQSQLQGQQVIFQTVDGVFTTQALPHFQQVSVPLPQPQPQVQSSNKGPDMESTVPPPYAQL